ncbi:phage terminase small subunit [Lelliottia nimipressuralis]|uniref:phage terminase small subunit n=1 Tax=Lelliottia nimipressuralis TaxID=69220 RepID=UPI0028A251B5|nr:phage terminase small subunit [Lelliottia nimipressuralis]
MAFNPISFSRQMRDKAKRKPAQQALAVNDSESLHLQLLALDRDLARLSALPRIQDRIELKRTELLPKWLPYVERYLAAGKVYEYTVFGWTIIWLFDVGEIEKALDWADIAISQEQPTPERLKSRFPAFVADQVLEWAEAQSQAGHSIEPYFSRVFKHVREDWRLHEKHTAKWYKFAGEFLLRDNTGKPAPSTIFDVDALHRSRELLLIADGLWPKIGVRSRITRIDARLRQLEKEGATSEENLAG